MKRIYKNNDLAFNLTINNFPINISLINSIEFRFYTLNNNNSIYKSKNDIDKYNQVILQWDELKTLEEGVLYYDYTVSLINDNMNDGTQDTVTKVMTQYYIVTGIDNINIDNNIDSTKYYTKDEVDELINDVVVGTIDLTEYYNKSEVDNKLNGYVEDDVLGSYYTKTEVNDLIDGIDIPTQDVDLSNYYKKSETYSQNEVNALIDGVSAGDVDLSEYYTKSEVDAKIIDDVHYIDYSTYSTADDFTQLQTAINNGSVIIVDKLPIIPFNNATVYNAYSVSNTGITLMCVSSQPGLSNGTKTNITYNTILITFTNSGGKSYNTYGTGIEKIGDGTKFLSDNGEYLKLNTPPTLQTTATGTTSNYIYADNDMNESSNKCVISKVLLSSPLHNAEQFNISMSTFKWGSDNQGLTNIVIPTATTSLSGLMSPTDKNKIDSLDSDLSSRVSALENKITEWTGTQSQYDALGTYDDNITYNIIEG